MSGKCQPGWTLLGDTCYMYLGGPMTYHQAVDFCAKDNATLPTITNFYQYHVLTHYLEQQQDDWRYYDMVWINDLDNADCNVFVDSTVKSISCDFMLPALCEMDEHVHLVAPTSVYELPKEVVYSSVTLGLMIVLVLLLCCCWCNKTRHRKKERLQRRDSIRMSKSSLGSRSLASMASTGFSDINYRRRFINNQQSKTGTVSSAYQRNSAANMHPSGSQQQINNGGGGHGSSFDSLTEKHSLAVADSTSYAYHSNPNPMLSAVPAGSSNQQLNSLGSHLSPNGGRSSFAETHDIHYAPGGGGTTLTFPQVHSASGYDLSAYDNSGYRPETRQSNQAHHALNTSGVGGGHDLSSLSQGPPGYQQQQPSSTTQRPDSVADMKRELKSRLVGGGFVGGGGNSPPDSGDDDMNTTGTTSDASSDPQADRGTDYQTMDRGYESSTFRPQQQQQQQQRESYTSPFGSRALPQTPAENIPSVPGYAKPVVTPTGTAQRPFHPPPSPPRSRPPPAARQQQQQEPRSRAPLLETSLDDSDDEQGPPHPPRARSVGQILETNLDDDDQDDVSRPVLPNSNGHSRSLGEAGFPRMSFEAAAPMLETDM